MAIKHVVRCDGDECDREPPVSEQPTPYAPDTVTTDPPEWMAEWQAYVADLDTSLEGQDEHLIHQDGFAAGWTLGTERSEDTVAALRARLEAAEQGEAKAWGCYANSETVNRELAEHLAKTERKLAAAEASSIRLAQALRWNAARSYADGRLPCWCPAPPDDTPDAWHAAWCLNARAALAEHDAAKGE